MKEENNTFKLSIIRINVYFLFRNIMEINSAKVFAGWRGVYIPNRGKRNKVREMRYRKIKNRWKMMKMKYKISKIGDDDSCGQY